MMVLDDDERAYQSLEGIIVENTAIQGSSRAYVQNLPVVLYIDDNQQDRILVELAARFSVSDVQFICVEDFSKGVDYLTGKCRCAEGRRPPPPAFILLDYHVHGRIGTEFLGWIRAQPRLASIPVCVYSDSDVSESIGNSYGAGADCFLVKATSFDRLRVVVRALASCAMTARPCLDSLSALPEHRCASSLA